VGQLALRGSDQGRLGPGTSEAGKTGGQVPANICRVLPAAPRINECMRDVRSQALGVAGRSGHPGEGCFAPVQQVVAGAVGEEGLDDGLEQIVPHQVPVVEVVLQTE
jgi:hypothetical protein